MDWWKEAGFVQLDVLWQPLHCPDGRQKAKNPVS
jgi:hypothetical protein